MSETEEECSVFEKLNDDCLIKIFEFVPIVDRFRLEVVSKRWQTVIQKSWLGFKHLSFQDQAWTSSSIVHKIKLNDKVLKKLIGRFGQYLISIDLNCDDDDDIFYRLTPESIQYIRKICLKLRSLDLGNMAHYAKMFCLTNSDWPDCKFKIIQWDVIEILNDWNLITTFKEFGLSVHHIDLKSLFSLIPIMTSLESLRIDFADCNQDSDNLMDLKLDLPFGTLKEIYFATCIEIEEEVLIDTVKKTLHLQTLSLSNLRNYKVLHNMSPSQREALENLSLTFVKLSVGNVIHDIEIFRNFVNLKRLSLIDNVTILRDDFLETLGNYCKQLVYLNISVSFGKSRYLTDNGIGYLVSLPKLKYLFMQGLSNVRGNTLKKMKNLEVLDCSSCRSIKEEGLCSMIRQSKLRILNVSRCKKITNKLLSAVIKEINTREEKVDFTFLTKDTQIRITDETIPPLLRIKEKHELSNDGRLSDYFPEQKKLWSLLIKTME